MLGVVAAARCSCRRCWATWSVGVLIGPHALALARTRKRIRHLGEFGVVFLMFVIGLEFTLPKLRAMRRMCSGWGCSRWC